MQDMPTQVQFALGVCKRCVIHYKAACDKCGGLSSTLSAVREDDKKARAEGEKRAATLSLLLLAEQVPHSQGLHRAVEICRVVVWACKEQLARGLS